MRGVRGTNYALHEPMKQMHVYFSGRVQGVGFRQTALRLARGFELTGWVKNLPDGRVEMLAEGESIELERFYKTLTQRMKNYIQETGIFWKTASQQFKEFDIAYE